MRPRTLVTTLALLTAALVSSTRAWASPRDPPSNVVMLELVGDQPLAKHQRLNIHQALKHRGYQVIDVDLSLADAAAAAGCEPPNEQCLVDIGRHVEAVIGIDFDYFVWGELVRDGAGEVHVFELASGRTVVSLELELSREDLILPEVLGDAVARRVVELRVPPAPATAAELEQLAGLDRTLPLMLPRPPDAPLLPLEVPPVHLRGDFENWCRVAPRDDERYGPVDLRPVCKLRPTFGYFRPRTWTSLSLTSASLLGTGVLYGLAFGAASRWEPSTTERLEIGAHVMLASTVVLGSVLAIVIASDRRQAKRFLDRLKRQTEL